jgi:hypothetical protein
MPTYCWSGATGVGDGSSWADAYTSIIPAWAATPDNGELYLASDHYELQSSGIILGSVIADPKRTISVDRADDSYLKAPAVQLDTSTFGDFSVSNSWFHGVFVLVGDDLAGSNAYFEDCTIEWQGATDTHSGSNSTFNNCTFRVYSNWESGQRNRWYGCDWIDLGGSGWYDSTGAFEAENFLVGCDLSQHNTTYGLCRNLGSAVTFTFDACKLAAGQKIVQGTPNSPLYKVHLIGCDVDGAGAGKTYRTEVHMMGGTSVTDTSVYRNGGWSDVEGDTPLSHLMTPSSLCSPVKYIESLPITAYLGTTGSKTFTVEIAEDFTVALNASEAWIEVDYLGTANSTRWTKSTSREPLGSTALTSSAETWTGMAGYTAHKLQKTVTVNKAGAYRVRVFLGKYEAGKSMAYCPKVSVA